MAGNVIVFIPDIHNLVKTSGPSYLSAADAILPVIKNDAFPIIGATYPREFRQYVEPRSDFAGLFETIHLSEISQGEAEKILVYESMLLENQKGIFITFGAIKAAVRLSKQYFRQKPLPSSAIELLKEAVAAAERKGERALGPREVVAVAEERSSIPIHEARGAEAEALLNLEEIIHARLVNQEEAVKAVASALREYRAGLKRPQGPIASFLFVGPTGVGKTELAKILAEVQFGSRGAIIRFDMTEYQEKAALSRFIGSPEGTSGGELTEAVLKKPYALVLLDEFEKAHPDILNLFLQVFDEGRLTDNLGRTVDFSNTVIIATSNAHSEFVHSALRQGQSMSQIEEYLKSRLTEIFRAELLNRFSKIIVFRDLAPAEVERIATLNLAELAETLKKRGIALVFDPDAVRRIAKLGYDPSLGVRPLRRVIEEQLRSPLAERLLKREFKKGSRVRVSVKDEEFQFQRLED